MGEFGENPDPREERFERYLAEQMFLKKEAGNLIDKHLRRNKNNVGKLEKHKIFVEEADKLGLNPDAIFSDIEEKMFLLHDIMGYTYLKIQEGKMSINNCSDAKIGRAFQNTYYTSLKTLVN